MKPKSIILSAFVMCLFFANAALAQKRSEDKEKRDKAEQYFARGEILFESGDFAKAAEAFLLAYETMPHHAVLLNAALSYERAGKLPEAIMIYEKYLAAMQEQGEEDEETEKRIDALNGKVGKLAITADCEDQQWRILVDGLEQGYPPVTMTVMPGSHKVEAMEEGEVASLEYVIVGAGEVLAVHLKAERKQEPIVKVTKVEFKIAESAADKGEKSKVKLKLPFWIASGVAVAGGGTALGLWLSVLKDEKDFKAEDEYEEQKSIKEKAESKQLAAGILAGTAGASAIAATVFAILNVKSSKKDKPDKLARIMWTPGPRFGVEVRF